MICWCAEVHATSYIHLSHRLGPSSAECSPPSIPSVVFCLLLSCSRWFLPSFLCHLAIFYLVVPLISSLSLAATLCATFCPPIVLYSCYMNRLAGLVIKGSASGAEDPGFESHLHCGSFWAESYQWYKKIGTAVVTLPGTSHYRVSAGTGQPGISILWLGEVESLICNFYLSVAARKIDCPWDTLACCWDVNLGKKPTNQKQSCMVCLAHFNFCFRVYSIMSIIFVLLLISEHGIWSCSFRYNIFLSIALRAVLCFLVVLLSDHVWQP